LKSAQTCLRIVLLFIAISCSDQTGKSNTRKIQEPITSPQIYHAHGVVKSIPPNKKQIVIDHGEIPGFMRAMTMPFNLPDSNMVEGIKPNDSVAMVIQYDGEVIVLKEISLINGN
jgi:Cu/Ag efflux protein CusF